eukprot:scaffold37671_cov42-Phaeocystis_antarctica.AAC.1
MAFCCGFLLGYGPASGRRRRRRRARGGSDTDLSFVQTPHMSSCVDVDVADTRHARPRRGALKLYMADRMSDARAPPICLASSLVTCTQLTHVEHTREKETSSVTHRSGYDAVPTQGTGLYNCTFGSSAPPTGPVLIGTS